MSSTYPSIRYSGKFFRISGASPFKLNTGTKSPIAKIPITISAKKSLMLRLSAKFADIWEASYLSPQEFELLNFEFERINQEIDNETNKADMFTDRTSTTKSIEIDVIIANSDSELEYKKRLFSMERGPGSYSKILRHGLIGTPEKVAERVKEYADMGINQLLLAFHEPYDLRALELFSDAVKGI